MQPVNDDMDDLFRRAAQNYPLNTQGADFDKLQQQMQASEKDEVPPKKEHRQRFTWLLLLLIPLPFLFEHHYKHTTIGNRHLATQQASTKDKTDKQIPPKKIPATAGDSILANLTIKSTPSANTTRATSTSTVPMQKDAVSKQVTASNRHSRNGVKNNEPDIEKALLSNKKKTPTKLTTANNQLASIRRRHNNKINRKSIHQIKDNSTQAVVIVKNGQQQALKKGSIASIDKKGSNSKADSTNTIFLIDSTKAVTQQKDTNTAAVAKVTAAKDSSTQDTTAQNKQLKKTDMQRNYWYAGVVVGPDYSVVKSTRTGNAGFNTGIIAGYHFAKHWAVETGLLWNHKSYYSDGQYVYTEKLMLPIHTQVLHINGYCDLLEIPLNVQYHFSSKSNGHWYVATGLASYLIKQEEYYYLYKRYNMEYYGTNDYSNSTKNWFSVLQLGGGYQLKVGKQNSLRFEPYIKLPVSKIGIARLPLSSTGLNIGFTVPL